MIPAVSGAKCKHDYAGKPLPGTSDWLVRRAFSLHITYHLFIFSHFPRILIPGGVFRFEALEPRFEDDELAEIWSQVVDEYTDWYVLRAHCKIQNTSNVSFENIKGFGIEENAGGESQVAEEFVKLAWCC